MVNSRLQEKPYTGAERAFTLIELVIYLGLVAIFVTPMTIFGWDVILGGVKADAHQEVQENLRFAAHRIQVEVRGADSINIGESDFGVNLAANPGTKVAFSGSGADYPASFRVDDGVLQIKRGAGSWTALTSSLVEVTRLTFYDLTDSNSENTRFILKVKHENPTERQEWEKESTFRSGAQLR